MNSPAWFSEEVISVPVEQGIIISNFEWFNFEKLTTLRPDDGSATEFDTLKHHVIILTQSCDLRKKSTKFIHICPVYSLSDYYTSLNITKTDSKRKNYESLSTNSIWSKHLLNTFTPKSIDAFTNDYLVVDFAKAMIVPFEYVKSIIAGRPGENIPMLNVPYRESMAQRYGQFFARVGNPIDLDDFEASSHISS